MAARGTGVDHEAHGVRQQKHHVRASSRASLQAGRALTVLPVLPQRVAILGRVVGSRHAAALQPSQRVHIQLGVCAPWLSCLWATSLPLQQSKGTVRWENPGGGKQVTGAVRLGMTSAPSWKRLVQIQADVGYC